MYLRLDVLVYQGWGVLVQPGQASARVLQDLSPLVPGQWLPLLQLMNVASVYNASMHGVVFNLHIPCHECALLNCLAPYTQRAASAD